MPNRTSLIRRLAELRSSYTGETDSSVLPAISAGGATLDPEDRASVLRILAHNYAPRLLGANTTAPLPARIRHALLPDATTPGQRHLEAAVLLALRRARIHLRHRTAPRQAGMFRMIRSRPAELVLHLEPATLPALLAELCPRVVDGALVGVPGLRVRLHRRHVQLFRVTAPENRILVADISHRQWLATTAYLRAATGQAPTPLHVEDADPVPLTAHETAALAAGSAALPPGLAALASSVLRRLMLLGERAEASAVRVGDRTLCVQWSGGLSAELVAVGLVHPLMGLPGDDFELWRVEDGLVHVRLGGGTGLTLELSRAGTPGETGREPAGRDLVAAWAVWEATLQSGSTPSTAAPAALRLAWTGAAS
ncbi:hypothetical protein GCM10010174_27840 [Kutzneria viridogrisea]|uniref:Uncharacterized protein n=1 Tax=Kutzneria viridogrisea TaxID=47990 RepID=A0ABR6BTG3_9PSEU|nr:hypothetical protein [Kutzneria viridogrisea]